MGVDGGVQSTVGNETNRRVDPNRILQYSSLAPRIMRYGAKRLGSGGRL